MERRAFKDVIEELNDGFGDGAGVKFEALGWEDTLASTGRRSQGVINREIDRCDVFILACTAGGGRRLRTLSRARRTRKKSFTARWRVGRDRGRVFGFSELAGRGRGLQIISTDQTIVITLNLPERCYEHARDR